MAKKAYLVRTELTTRIVIEESELNNDELISSLVSQNLIRSIENGEVLENIAAISEDTEVPYINN